VATNDPNVLLKFLEKEETEEKLERIYDDLVKSIRKIFDLLFSSSITTIQDWFLHIIETPECANALGMPLGSDFSGQVRSVLASESGFTYTLRQLIFVRLYETFLITHWLFKNPLCPKWLFEYKDNIEDAMKWMRKEYIEYDKVVEEVEKNGKNKIDYNHKGIENAFEYQDWGKFHYTFTPYPQWLIPLLRYLNYPHAFGKDSIALKGPERKNAFKKFVSLLNKQSEEWIETLDLSVLLWCIDTLALNYKENKTAVSNYKELFRKLLISILKKRHPLSDDTYRIEETKLKGVTVLEVFKGIDRSLFFSAGWAFELYLLERIAKDDNPIKNKTNYFYRITKKAIDHLLNNPSSSHIYLLCLRLWFLLECWYNKSILAAEFLSKNESKEIDLLNSRKKMLTKKQKDNGLIKYYYQIADRFYCPSFFDRFFFKENKNEKHDLIYFLEDKVRSKIKNSSKLPGTIYSIFILGGAGAGKTSFLKKCLPVLLEERFGIKCSYLRITPLEIQVKKTKIFEAIQDKIPKNGKSLLILFIDEIHIPCSPSPFAVMLDSLQEYRFMGNFLGNECDKKGNLKPWNILYFFASSAYSSRDEFESIARNKGDVAMSDFATRVKYWIKLPELWQIPMQKFVISYKRTKNKKLSAAITISGDVKSTRELEQLLDSNVTQKDRNKYIAKISKEQLRGNIGQLLNG